MAAANHEKFGIVAAMDVDGVFFVTCPDIDDDPILDQREVPKHSRLQIGDCINFNLGPHGALTNVRLSNTQLKFEIQHGSLIVETMVAFYPLVNPFKNFDEVNSNRVAYSPHLHNVFCAKPPTGCERNHLYQVYVERLSPGNRKIFDGKCVAWAIHDVCLVETKEQQLLVDMPWYKCMDSGRIRLPYKEISRYYKSFTENYEGIVSDLVGKDALVWSNSIRSSKVLFFFGRDDGLHLGDHIEFNCKPLLRSKHDCHLEGKKFEVIEQSSYDSESDPRHLIEVGVTRLAEDKPRFASGSLFFEHYLLGTVEISPENYLRLPIRDKVKILVQYKPWTSRSHSYWKFVDFSPFADCHGNYPYEVQEGEVEQEFAEYENGSLEVPVSHHRTRSDEGVAEASAYPRNFPPSASQDCMDYPNATVYPSGNQEYLPYAPAVTRPLLSHQNSAPSTLPQKESDHGITIARRRSSPRQDRVSPYFDDEEFAYVQRPPSQLRPPVAYREEQTAEPVVRNSYIGNNAGMNQYDAARDLTQNQYGVAREIPRSRYYVTREDPPTQYDVAREDPRSQYDVTRNVTQNQYNAAREIPRSHYYVIRGDPVSQYDVTREDPRSRYEVTREVPGSQHGVTRDVSRNQYDTTRNVDRNQYDIARDATWNHYEVPRDVTRNLYDIARVNQNSNVLVNQFSGLAVARRSPPRQDRTDPRLDEELIYMPPPPPKPLATRREGRTAMAPAANSRVGNNVAKENGTRQPSVLSEDEEVDRLQQPIFGLAPPQPAHRENKCVSQSQHASGSARAPKQDTASGFGKNVKPATRSRVPSHLCHTSAFMTGIPNKPENSPQRREADGQSASHKPGRSTFPNGAVPQRR